MVAVAVIVAALVGGLGAGLGATFGGGSNTSSISITSLPRSTSSSPVAGSSSTENAIYDAVKSAIVDINTNVASAAGEAEQAAGTGMIITSSGEVLTNNHVIKDATTIEVSIEGRSGPDNGQYPVKVLGVDPTQDVALLQIEGASGLPVVSLGNSSSVTVGEQVYAIGNAGGLGGSPTVVAGAVTALDRSITASDQDGANSETLGGLVQTDATIEAGDSGGPMVDSSGQVVGMDTAASTTDSEETIGFAIPINHATEIAKEIAAGKTASGIILGYSPFLGVELAVSGSSSFGFGGNGLFGSGNTGTAGATPSVAGVQIEGVVANGPAESAGLVGGDTITAVGNTQVTTESGLTAAIARFKPDQSTTITYVDSSGVSHAVPVKFSAIPQ
jgi:S1-C subfamily serine protease